METSYLYLDNFRGFKDSLLPIKDVNFFVGENSTGKSSILALIKLIEDVRSFWMSARPQFTSTDVDLGNFDDIVSIHSRNRTYFRIGMINAIEKDGQSKCKGFLLTFKKREGMPSVYRYTFRDVGKQIDFKYGTNRIWYKYQEPSELSGCSINEIKKIFDEWSHLHEKNVRGYRVLPKRIILTSLAYLNSLLAMEVEREEDVGKRLLQFEFVKFFEGNTKWIAPIRSKPKRTYDLYGVGCQ